MIIDYVDKHKIKRRVQVPDTGAVNLEEGIPISLHLDELFPEAPIEFRRELINQLWDMGFIVPNDFLQPGAADRIRAVLLSVVKHDAMSIQAYAREVLNNG